MSLSLNEDGTLSLTAGTPDIGGLRASLCMMAAEELKVPLDKIRVQIGDTGQLGYNFLTGGSRATFSSGMATVDAAREVMKEACKRAAKLWELPEDAVEYVDGAVRPAGPNAGKHTPMTLTDIAGIAGKTGGPIAGYARINAAGRGAELRHPHRRRRGRPRDGHACGSCATRRSRTRAAPSTRATSRASTRAAWRRASAGR